jgi:hypothetical protein
MNKLVLMVALGLGLVLFEAAGHSETPGTSDQMPPLDGAARASVANAYQFLANQMDQYNKEYFIYKDQNAGGNHFVPSGWMGDMGDIGYDDGWTTNTASGPTCIRLSYSAASTANKWAAIAWQSKDSNWGQSPGLDLTGATKLRFQARGENGTEKAIFKVGGINRQPYKGAAATYPYEDSCDEIAIGPVTLNKAWTDYSIDLATTETFKIYSDDSAASNHFIPSAWYNGASTMTCDPACTDSPHSGSTCVKITWTGEAGLKNGKWNGIGWEWPEGRIQSPSSTAQGYNLDPCTKLTFWSRTDNAGLKLQFIMGFKSTVSSAYSDPCGEIPITTSNGGFVSIGSTWQQYTIPIPSGTDMSNVTLGFAVFFNDANTPGGAGMSFYLDDIEFDHPLKKDLSSLIGGFVWTTSQVLNPSGATIYVDNARYDLARPNETRLIQSYVTLDGGDEAILNNVAASYDNALALIAFSLSNDPDHLKRAKMLADAFVQAINNDRDFTDGRVRNDYRAGDLFDPYTGKALLPGWWSTTQQKWLEDKDFVGTKVGDAAWVALALLRYYRVSGDAKYLTAAESIGNWIINNTWNDAGIPGFTGGYYGWPDGTHGWYPWESVEHNLDCWRIFDRLDQATSDSKWQSAALHAKQFAQNMWNDADGFFEVGTNDDKTTINASLKVLDANSWGIQAFFPSLATYSRAAAWVEANCATSNGGFDGFDYNDDRDGVWLEGTAQMCVSYMALGHFTKASHYAAQLRAAQESATNADGLGIVAATKNSLTTGQDWTYYNRLHVGATAWAIFAQTGYDPFIDAFILEASGRDWRGYR